MQNPNEYEKGELKMSPTGGIRHMAFRFVGFSFQIVTDTLAT